MALSGGTTLGASGSCQMPGKEKPIAHISTENYALFIGGQGPKPPQGPSSASLQNPRWCVWAHSVFVGSTLGAPVSTPLKKLPKLGTLLSARAASIWSGSCVRSSAVQFCSLNRTFSTGSTYIGIDLVYSSPYSRCRLELSTVVGVMGTQGNKSRMRNSEPLVPGCALPHAICQLPSPSWTISLPQYSSSENEELG